MPRPENQVIHKKYRCRYFFYYRLTPLEYQKIINHFLYSLHKLARQGMNIARRNKILFTLWNHREHTLLLNRKGVNKGMKRINSLPLSPVVLTRPYCRENRYLQVLRSTVALNSYLGFSALCRNFFVLCLKFDKGGNSFTKHFECRTNLYKPLPRLVVFLARPKSPDLRTETKSRG